MEFQPNTTQLTFDGLKQICYTENTYKNAQYKSYLWYTHPGTSCGYGKATVVYHKIALTILALFSLISC